MAENKIDSVEWRLKNLFGSNSTLEPLNSNKSMGKRVHGIDLTRPFSIEQAKMVVKLLDLYKIISFPSQDRTGFNLRHLERLANYFGAPIPHPKNYANYGEFKKNKTPLELLPAHQQTCFRCDQAFPDHFQCTEGANSPAVYVVNNLVDSGPDKKEELVGGLHWHTDIEFEPIPLSTSMFYVQAAPATRSSNQGTWVDNISREVGFYHPDSDADLTERRNDLPLNGETAYADTAAAYADLTEEKRQELDKVMVRRRMRASDPGWLIPLVYENPRTREKSLHSPIWASRGKNIAPVEVEGMTIDQSRRYLNQLEAHIPQSRYRYDHKHTPGDVTIWSNFSTVHNAPPAKSIINTPEDARLMYRISCKGEPNYRLPRNDPDEWIASNISPPYRSPTEYFES